MYLIQSLFILVFLTWTESTIISNTLYVDLGDKAFYDLDCTLYQNSNLKPRWFKNGQEIFSDNLRFKLIKLNNTLRLINIRKNDHEGDYICKIFDGSKTWNLTIKVRAKLEIIGINSKTHARDVNSFNLLEGENLELTCEVLLKAFQDDKISINWYRTFENGGTQMLDFPAFEIFEKHSNVDKKFNSVVYLILKKENIGFEDRASYTCEVSNGRSKVNHTVMVRVKEKLGALWPFLGIVGEVAILCTIIFIHEKRRNKPKVEESEDNATKSGIHPKMTR